MPENAFEEANEAKSLSETGGEESAASTTGAIVETLSENPSQSGGNFRWVICALLFFATTINYIDRQVLGILAKPLQQEMGWSESDYGYIATAFTGAYAVGLLVVGRLMDWLGTRKGFSFAIVFWSLAAMAHAFARSAFGFGVARFALGIGEAGNFPAAVKTTAEWFPKKERALATGIFNSGSNVGAIITPLIVPFIAINYGWRWAFIITGSLGFIWLGFWLILYRRPEEHPRLSSSELAYIRSDPPEPTSKIAWASLFPHRQTWAFAAGKFFTDPVWWFFLFWLAKFLNENYGLSLSQLSAPLIVIYLAADFGSIGGGYLSSALIKRGWTVNAGRKTAMLVCALCVVPIYFAVHAENLWTAVGFISLAAAAHQGFSANLFTLVSDMFPRRAVGSVVGIGGFAGSVSGMIATAIIGNLLQITGSYAPVFAVAGFAYLFALLVIHLLVPRMDMARVGGDVAADTNA
ncbi:MAG: MFS transporter [Blastocatellia bacterium]|nr:MFS transporter [Blastocatellia bacterium]